MVTFQIVDTGIGIEDTSNLFQPFQQATREISEQYGGTGLGLNISKELIACMGGRIEISSELGVGTTISAHVPFKSVASNRISPVVTSISQNPKEAKRPQNARILVVEDNHINQKVLVRMLKNVGYTNVVVAADGQEGLNHLFNCADNPFDLVFMDCLMPVMNGWDATRKLREWEASVVAKGEKPYGPNKSSRMLVIALTANATMTDRDECLEVGMDEFLIKPVTMDRIQAVLSAYLVQDTATSAALK